MSEVSCRVTQVLLELMRLEAIDMEASMSAAGLDRVRLGDPRQHIRWEDFANFLDRIEEAHGPGVWDRVAPRIWDTRWNRLLGGLGRFAWTEAGFWRVVVRRIAPSLYRNLEFSVDSLPDGRLRMTAEIPEPHRGCEAHQRLLGALVLTGPRFLGRQANAQLEQRISARRGEFIVEPTVQSGRVSRALRGLAGLLIGAPAVREFERRQSESAAIFAELERRNRSLATLQAVADAITHSLDFAGTAARIVNAVAENTEFKAVALYVRTQDGASLELAARHDPGRRPGTNLPDVLPLKAGLGGDGFDAEGISWVAGQEQHHELHPEIRRRLGELGMQAAVVVPLRFHDQTIGALGLAATRRRSFDAEDEAALLALGKTAAAALMAARHVVAMEREVKERQRVEQALRESEERLREVAENVEGVFYLLDADNDRVLYLSPGFERLTGHPPDAVMKDIRSIFQWVHPDDRERLLEVVGETGELAEYEVEFRLFRADGSLMHIRDRATLIRNAEGRPIRILGFSQDVTRTRELEHQLRHSRKIEAVGRLAGGIAHDFNNLLTVISGYGEVLRDHFDSEDPAGTSVDEILRATDRASALTRRLLTLARKQPARTESLELGALVEELAPMLRSLLGETVALEMNLVSEPLPVRIDRSQLEQVVMNIAVNARDAMPDGGSFGVETRRLGPETVALVMRDTGQGMEPGVEARAFEPFFSTKDPGQGTGLGLATALSIIEQAGGRIQISSALGQGSCFQVELPWVEFTDREPVVPTPPAAGGSETLLLVEDQAQVRAVASRALRERGYRVIECSDAEGALACSGDPEIALLVTDVVMPEMSGPMLARQMAVLRPELPVLFLSGYTGEEMPEGVGPSGAFLAKPFTSEALATAVRSCLDAKPRS